MSDKENMESTQKKLWLLVSWIGSFPKIAYDIVNFGDVVFDNIFTEKKLKVGCAIMVRCGKIKSAATVLQISDNTDALYAEFKKLKNSVLTENITNILSPDVKTKKRKGDEVKKVQVHNRSTQTDIDENTISKLLLQNQKLKAELYEANKTINSMCKDLKNIVQGTQKRMLTSSNDGSSSDDSVKNSPKRSKISLSPSDSIDIKIDRDDNDQVFIGSGKTAIPRYVYNQVNWLSFTAATRKLLMAVFSRDILATHSLTGKPSPAFMGSEMPVKMRLDATKVSDIVETVSSKCGVTETMVRSAITTKCADENKMFKKRSLKNEK